MSIRLAFFLLLSLLPAAAIPETAHAEGGCPAGMYPIGGGSGGWSGCAPIPEGPGATQNPGPQWSKRWGAVAVADGAFGVAEAQKSKRSAEKSALSQCKNNGGRNCSVMAAYYNQCVALAWGPRGNISASAAYIAEAEKIALQRCQAEKGECKLFYSACSYAERIR